MDGITIMGRTLLEILISRDTLIFMHLGYTWVTPRFYNKYQEISSGTRTADRVSTINNRYCENDPSPKIEK